VAASGRRLAGGRPCRRGRLAGPGAGSRAVAGGAALPPLRPAAGFLAGRQGGLASRPGPQASTRDSARPVKSTRHRGGGPDARTEVTGRYGAVPARPEETAPGAGRRAGQCEGDMAARAARAPVIVVLTPPASRQCAALLEGLVMGRLAPPFTGLSAHVRNPVFGGFFHVLWNQVRRQKDCRPCCGRSGGCRSTRQRGEESCRDAADPEVNVPLGDSHRQGIAAPDFAGRGLPELAALAEDRDVASAAWRSRRRPRYRCRRRTRVRRARLSSAVPGASPIRTPGRLS
jgi:hypothetical protein